jgi:hypothetical protein
MCRAVLARLAERTFDEEMIVSPSVEESLRKQLRRDGLTDRAVDAVWPAWWSAEAEASPSATTELRFTLARRLGLSPASLFEDGPQFVWRDDARFKNLGDLNDHEAAVLASFCVGVASHLISALDPPGNMAALPDAAALRRFILRDAGNVNLTSLLVVCWAVRLPIVQLRVFPLRHKGMHAVATRAGEQNAILIGRESRFRAQVCFWIAHEVGHIALGHLGESCALLDVEDPAEHHGDAEEGAADRYALELLTGSPSPEITISSESYSATQLASAVLKEAPSHQIDPAVLALCAAHQDGKWERAFGALKILQDEDDVPTRLNELASSQLDLGGLSVDNGQFLRTVMGLDS